MSNFKTIQYICMADEQGACFHTHVFVCFSSRVRFSTVKKYFPKAHIESVKEGIKDNIDYIKKSGKWANDIKHGTSIENSYQEYGTPPPETKGKRHDMKELYALVSMGGWTNAEILARKQDILKRIIEANKQHGYSDNGYLFLNEKGRIHEKNVDYRIRKYCRHVGLSEKAMHKIRKTYISTLIDGGLNINEVRKQAGHEDERTTYGNYCFNRLTDTQTENLMEKVLSN